MTREEKLKFIEQMEQEERDQRAADLKDYALYADLKDYALYAERKGTLPPSGSSPEDQQRRAEWYAAHRPRGVWVNT